MSWFPRVLGRGFDEVPLSLDERRHPTGQRWVRKETFRSRAFGQTETWHLDDVPWYDAPVPHKRHRCTPQTYGLLNGLLNGCTMVTRCACGAIDGDLSGRWTERNTRTAPATAGAGGLR